MEFTVPPKASTNTASEKNIGLDDVTRSVRALLLTTRNLGTASLEVVERELAMAISVSEQVRDGLVTSQALERSRQPGVMNQFRSDAHRSVDIAIDAGAIVYNSALELLERFADTRRSSGTNNQIVVKRE